MLVDYRPNNPRPTTQRLAGLIAGLMLTSAAPALAQEAASAPAEGQEAGGIEDIIVTAQKRNENLQDVPIAVSAVTSASIEKLHANTLQGLQGTVPSIQINNFSNTPNTAVFHIRGIGIIEPDPYAGNTVSIVVDGVPQFFSMGALLDLFDIERIEILRGPQGTLFGANTTGGVVNVVTRQPSGEFGVKGELTYGNWNRFDVRAAVDFPITENLSGKIVGSHTQRDGFVTNVFNGKDMGKKNVTAFRGYLKYDSGDFDATLMGEYVFARNGAPVVVNGAVPGEALYVAPGTLAPGASLPMYVSPCLPAGTACRAPEKYYAANDSTRDISDMDTYSANLTMNWHDSPIGDITAITAYKKFKLFEETDQDGTPLFLDDTRRTTRGWQLSQELRTSVDITDGFNVIAGGFYMKTHYDHDHRFRVQFALPGLHQENPQDQDNYSVSAFLQSYIDLTDRLRAQAGIRYSHERTRMIAGVLNYVDPSGVAQFDGGIFIPSISFIARGAKAWNNVGWKLGLDYKPTDNALLYGYWARGFKSGGFTGRVGIPSDIGPYDPEKVDTFEAGIKADWLDRHLRTNFSVFYTNYRDLQLPQIYFSEDANGNFIQGNTILNAAKAEIKGFEFETTVVPVDGLTIVGSLAYLDAKYKDFPFTEISANGTAATRNLKGLALQNAPKWAGSFSINYEIPMFAGKTDFGFIYTYTSSKFLTSLVDTERSRIRPAHLVNANIDYTPDGSWWSLGLWARNLLDTRYVQATFDAPGTFANLGYTPPREYGATLKFTF